MKIMTRPIKFRAWIPEKKKMVHFERGYYCGEYNSLAFELREADEEIKGANHSLSVNPKIENIMQLTGLHDKNGVEIYEGDILLIGDDSLDQDYDEEQDDYVDKVKAEVVYCGEDGYPAFDIKPNPFEEVNGLSHLDAVGRMEVIGNVYENPELLEERNDKRN